MLYFFFQLSFFAFAALPVYNFDTPNSEDTPYYQQKLAPGQYLFECWGASGGGTGETMRKGGYVSGSLTVNKTSVFYIVVGSVGDILIGGFNGGGDGGIGYLTSVDVTNINGYGGGGATDIRIDIEHNSSIIIAGGGGGACGYSIIYGGHAGGIIGGASRINTSADPSCIGPLSPGGNKENSTKWEGSDGSSKTVDHCYYCSREGNGGGGGGFYGGGTTTAIGGEIGQCSGGGGGSSCISGHPECDVINGIYFSNITMYNGTELFRSPYGNLEYGHTGNGYARISYITPIHTNVNPMLYQKKKRLSIFL